MWYDMAIGTFRPVHVQCALSKKCELDVSIGMPNIHITADMF